LALDPQSVAAQINMAGVLVNRVTAHMTGSVDADVARAEGLVDRALDASPRTAYAHYVKGTVLRWQNRWDEAISEFETALTLDRNLVGALQGLGRCKLYTGSIEEVIPLAGQAMRLDCSRRCNSGPGRRSKSDPPTRLALRQSEGAGWLEGRRHWRSGYCIGMARGYERSRGRWGARAIQ
jgi:hypothetical protein